MSNYGIILAGGTGSRMGDVKLPKQFLEINNTPIIILTIRQLLKSNLFDSICVAIHPDWVKYLGELLVNYSIDKSKVSVIEGGSDRLGSIENSLDFFKSHNASEEDIVVIHDAVRPFISQEILKSAVEETSKYGATVAITPVKDTMICSENGIATDMPDRSKIFHGQAPDSFKFGLIYDSLKSLTDDERKYITGTAQICQAKGIEIHTYPGDEKNIKITTIVDLFLAKAIYGEFIKE